LFHVQVLQVSLGQHFSIGFFPALALHQEFATFCPYLFSNNTSLKMDSKLDSEGYGQKVEAVEHVPQKDVESADDLAGKDRAAQLLKQSGQSVVVTPENNNRILRKIDLTILPIMLAVYFLQGLDKATLSYASVFGLVQDAGLVGEDYSWLGSIVYIAQLVLQPVIAYFLVKLPTGKFAAVMVLCWGSVLSFMALAKNFKGLLATRFFLGAFEAAVGRLNVQLVKWPLAYFISAPTFVAISQMWWVRSEQTNRNAAWYAMNGVTNMVLIAFIICICKVLNEAQVGSLISYGLGHIHSDKLYSYQVSKSAVIKMILVR
jgi:hypothetical protein